MVCIKPTDLQTRFISFIIRLVAVSFSITLRQLRHDPEFTVRNNVIFSPSLPLFLKRLLTYSHLQTDTKRSLLFQKVIDSKLQRSGFKQQQRTESVEERLKGLWQVCFLVCNESWWQGVQVQLLHRHIGQRHTD